jgi:intein-encoded DNA endonuclease-like protein
MRKRIFSSDELDKLFKMYLDENLSQQKIADEFKCSRKVIKRVLKENDISIRNKTHTYKADYRAFKEIDSEEKAYWLGFIAADGNIYIREKNASVKISLSRIDRDHLVKFREFMKSNVKIRDYIQTEGFSNNSEMSEIVFNSKEMAQDFIDKNVPPRKSLILKPPNIDSKFYIPYIRGYFDGDGSLYQNKNGNWTVSIEGTKEMLLWINEVLNFGASKLEQRKETENNSYYIRAGGTLKPFNIVNQLYQDATIYLDRKFENYALLSKSLLQ